MERDNVVQRKSFDFAVKAIKLSYSIQEKRNEYDLSRQLIRCSSSIGANLEEAMGGYSDKDFLHKVTISYKEARETDFWIRLMEKVGLISHDEKAELQKDIKEILRLLGAIRRTMKNKLKKK